MEWGKIMSDELQPEAVEPSNVTLEDLQPTETPAEPGGESATPQGEEAPPQESAKVTFSDEQQKIVDGIVGKKVYHAREAERRADSLKQENDELRRQLPTETRPVVPTVPDRYDFDTDEAYNQSVTNRDTLIGSAAAFDGRQIQAKINRDVEQRMAEEAALVETQKDAKTYFDRASELGIKQQDILAAGQMVANMGIQDEVASFILTDETGPLITQYLAANPLVLDEIRRMSPMNAAIEISSVIKPKAAELKPRTTQAPDPVEPLRGAGVPPLERGPAGATFE